MREKLNEWSDKTEAIRKETVKTCIINMNKNREFMRKREI